MEQGDYYSRYFAHSPRMITNKGCLDVSNSNIDVIQIIQKGLDNNMQDPDPLPWGALDRFQAHFIVRKDTDASGLDYVAKTKLTTTGYFAAKKVVSVKWEGNRLAYLLNQDSELNDLIAKQSFRDASITVEPTDDAVRIHGKWQNNHDLGITKELFEIYDKIAGHIKKL